jgi:hypothetical protein
MTDFVVTMVEGTKFLQAIIERLELCRACGCINGCWELKGKDKDVLAVIVMDDTLHTFHTKVPSDGGPLFHFEYSSQRKRLAYDLEESPLNDSVLMDELYLIFHHQRFGMCTLRNKKAQSPMDRLEKVEAVVQDLLAVLQPDKQESKRQKLGD